ncbi:ABC transporter substrate-binding protein [Rhizobium sp. L1K21]|uniref:ABC transporter substrate-binding protein n=1 Tax=Rhizobium sp. L1K21 TaxID=2954933 RepID=UPI0020922C47|nr:ABC transporter substrate-binding protein [Rhizobium sp. L1K21]MCO6188528.1 ABC transporter substrate-binding protein [Rhizobium sp. L1K21]
MRFRFITAAAALLSTVVFAPVYAEVRNDADTLALAARIDNNSFDRAELMLGNQLQYWQPVFDTLLVETPEGEIVPNLATEWSYNDDNTVLTLKLRDGVKFTDGTPFNAEAVKANLEYLAAGNGQNAYMARGISSFEIVSDNEIKLHLKAPDPALVNNFAVAAGAMASPASLGKAGSDVVPVGSGAYIYDTEDSVEGSQYVYHRNPDYWNAEAYPFDTVTITPMTDTVARMNAITAGQVDGTVADTRAVAQAKAIGLQVHTKDVNWAGIILADRAGKIVPALGDVRVRQAINMAFDKASILKFVDQGFGHLSDQIFPKSSQAYDPDLDSYYPYDPEKARSLLKEAGYEDGFEIIFPEIKPFAAFYPIITQQLADIGITATFESLPPGSSIPVIRSGKYAAYVFTFGAHDAWTDIQQHITPDAGWNALKYSDDKLNEMIKTAQFLSGEDYAAELRKINRYIVENAFFAPWYRQDTIYLTNAETNAEMQTTNTVPFIRNYSKAN